MDRIVTDKELANEIDSQKNLRPKRFSEIYWSGKFKRKNGDIYRSGKKKRRLY